jgi:cellobiose transport system permease protein
MSKTIIGGHDRRPGVWVRDPDRGPAGLCLPDLVVVPDRQPDAAALNKTGCCGSWRQLHRQRRDRHRQHPLLERPRQQHHRFTAVSASVVLFSTLAGYAFAKLKFRGREGLLIFVIATMAVPTQLGIVPLFIIMSKLGWTGSLWAVIAPAMVTAFGVF